MRRDAECVQPDAVARGFVVEAEIVAGVPDFAQTFFESNPARSRARIAVSGHCFW